MMLNVFIIFFKTLIYTAKVRGKSQAEIRLLKQEWAQLVMRYLGFKLTTSGQPPASGIPHVIVGNHISFVDIPLLMAVFPDVQFIAKDDLQRWPILGPAATAAGTLFVDRNARTHRNQLREHIVNHLQNNSIVVFPSGTTVLDEKNVSWKKGIFEIAQQAQVPIQLFKISYTPLRECAYIDDDNLMGQLFKMIQIKNKQATMTWLGQYEKVANPAQMAEELRLEIISYRY